MDDGKQEKVDVVILGAGITGLVTAFELINKGKRILLLEKEAYAGGKLQTLYDDDFVFEKGPNTGVIGNQEIVDFFRKIEDKCNVEIAHKEAKKRLIWKDGKFHLLPSGLFQAIKTPLFTWKDKFRILFEPFRAKGNNEFESIASLAKRRLGDSYLDYAVDPFISGIYAGDPEQLITKYAMPKLYNLEQEYGSFIRGAVKKKPILKEEKERGVSKDIFSIKGGFSKLTDALFNAIPNNSKLLSTGDFRVESLTTGEYKIHLKDHKKTIQASQVISTVPAYAISDVFDFINSEHLDKITQLKYAPVIQIGVGIKNCEMPKAFGGLFPTKESQMFLGILFNSSCYDERAPKDGVSLSFFMGGAKHPELMNYTDHQLKYLVQDALHDMFGLSLSTKLDAFHVFRHKKAIPQYLIDSKERFEAIKRIESSFPGLYLAGSIRDGISIADRIKQGVNLARGIN